MHTSRRGELPTQPWTAPEIAYFRGLIDREGATAWKVKSAQLKEACGAQALLQTLEWPAAAAAAAVIISRTTDDGGTCVLFPALSLASHDHAQVPTARRKRCTRAGSAR
jgi:hypothetical protein